MDVEQKAKDDRLISKPRLRTKEIIKRKLITSVSENKGSHCANAKKKI